MCKPQAIMTNPNFPRGLRARMNDTDSTFTLKKIRRRKLSPLAAIKKNSTKFKCN